MHGEGITSNFIHVGGWHMENIKILNNTGNEYYEQFVEVSLQHSQGVLIAGNTAVTTKGHPALGPTEPFAVMLTPGHSGSASGIIDKVWIVNNDFSHKGISINEQGNSGGVQISEDQASRGYQFGFGRIYDLAESILSATNFATKAEPSDYSYGVQVLCPQAHQAI
jgi:hypothetical protein